MRRPRISKDLCTTVPLMLLILAGCSGGSSERTNLSGTATFEDEPIVYGSVTFLPDVEAGHSGPTGMARIVDGKYDTRGELGQGIVPGKYIIRVTGYLTAPPVHEDETVEAPAFEPLFYEWEMKTDLSGRTYDIVVPAEARGFKPAGSEASRRRANDP